MTETTTTNKRGFEQRATAGWLHEHVRPLFAHLAVALHNGETKRIAETMVQGIDRKGCGSSATTPRRPPV